MRVEPELTTHLKFRRLKAAVGDTAMECLITIWGHCQQNQRGEYWPGADAAYVEDMCFWTGQKGELFRALVECGRPKLGFIVPENGGLRIHDWEEANSSTVKNWYRNTAGRGAKSGSHGGAHGLEATGKPRDTRGQATGKPRLTGGISEAASADIDPTLGQNPETPLPAEISAGSNGLATGSHGHPTASPDGSHGGAHGDPNLSLSFSPSFTPPLTSLYAEAKRLIGVLNQLTGSRFNPPLPELDQIVSRLHEVQYDFAGVEKMLRHRCALWLNDPKGRLWLKPGTLFGPNFHDYFGQRDVTATPAQNKNGRAAATDRTDLLQTLAAARAQLEQNPADATLQQNVRELEALTA